MRPGSLSRDRRKIRAEIEKVLIEAPVLTLAEIVERRDWSKIDPSVPSDKYKQFGHVAPALIEMTMAKVVLLAGERPGPGTPASRTTYALANPPETEEEILLEHVEGSPAGNDDDCPF